VRSSQLRATPVIARALFALSLIILALAGLAWVLL
jgi:hypothetical protein